MNSCKWEQSQQGVWDALWGVCVSACLEFPPGLCTTHPGSTGRNHLVRNPSVHSDISTPEGHTHITQSIWGWRGEQGVS